MSETSATLVAGVGCGATVNAHVCVQVAELFETPATLGARVRAFASVHTLMSFKTGEHRKALTTLRAREGTLCTAVAEPMALEASSVPESLTAFRAHKRLFTRVDAPVLPQVAQVVEAAAAVSALVATFHLLLTSLGFARACLPPQLSLAALTSTGRGAGLSSLSALFSVHQLHVLLQERRVRAEGSTEGADEGRGREVLV